MDDFLQVLTARRASPQPRSPEPIGNLLDELLQQYGIQADLPFDPSQVDDYHALVHPASAAWSAWETPRCGATTANVLNVLPM